MTYNTVAKRDYLIALAIFHSRYVALFKLLSTYPTHQIDTPGAVGNLSVRQTVAYLCNLLDTANQCFGDFDAGNTQTDVCDPESEVWRDATPYEALTWPGLYAELRRLTQELLAHAVAADTQKRAGDLRYRKWLTRLSVDCVEMMHQLEESLDMDSRQQT